MASIAYRTSPDSECERIFREFYKLIALNGDVSGKIKKEQAEAIEKLENALQQLESENMGLKTRIGQLQKQLAETNENLSRVTTSLEDLTLDVEDMRKQAKLKLRKEKVVML